MSESDTAPPKVKRPAVKYFMQRLDREGRMDEFRKRLATVRSETKLGYNQARRATMLQMGYEGPKAEHKRHNDWLASEQRKLATVIDHKVKESIQMSQAHQTFEEALTQLPLSADSQVENEWILAHPALSRKTRATNDDEPVLIAAADLLEAKHGPCPSAAAANKLQYWANNPKTVYENLANVMKKNDGCDPTKDSEIVEDDGIEELERAYRMLCGTAKAP